jgi:hypothetical protein
MHECMSFIAELLCWAQSMASATDNRTNTVAMGSGALGLPLASDL